MNKQALAGAGMTLTLMVGCTGEVSDTGNRTDSTLLLRPEVANLSDPGIRDLADRYTSQLLGTHWSGAEAIGGPRSNTRLYTEAASPEAENARLMLASAIDNTHLFIDTMQGVLNDRDVQDPMDDFTIELDETANVYMIYKDPATLQRLVENYRYGAITGMDLDTSGQVREILTLLAPFERKPLVYNSELDNTRWDFQSLICANHLRVVPGDMMLERVHNDSATETEAEMKLTERLEQLEVALCRSLALAQVSRDGEARGIVENGYAYYARYLDILAGGGEIPEAYILPADAFIRIRP